MSELARGLVLLVSLLLWLPFLRPVLGGDLTIEQGVLRYAATLLLAWAGVAGLCALVGGYAARGEQVPEEQEGAAQEGEPGRRAADRSS